MANGKTPTTVPKQGFGPITLTRRYMNVGRGYGRTRESLKRQLRRSCVEKECSKLMAWVKRCMEKESVSKTLVDPLKIYEYVCSLKKRYGIE
ncbi:hypothetical protein AAC387_Pa05g3588 [Persea americana]